MVGDVAALVVGGVGAVDGESFLAAGLKAIEVEAVAGGGGDVGSGVAIVVVGEGFDLPVVGSDPAEFCGDVGDQGA